MPTVAGRTGLAATAGVVLIATVVCVFHAASPSPRAALESLSVHDALVAAARASEVVWGTSHVRHPAPFTTSTVPARATGVLHLQDADAGLTVAGRAVLDAQQAAAGIAQPQVAPQISVSQWTAAPGVSKRMITTYPGSNPRGTQVRVNIPHSRVQETIRDDPVQSAEAEHDIRALGKEQERLKLVARGHQKILLHKLRMLDDKLRDVVQLRQTEQRQALKGAYSQDSTMTKAQEAIRSAQDLLAATRIERKYRWAPAHHDSATRTLPSQAALAAAQRARQRLHDKWLESHPWERAHHPAAFASASSQALAMRLPSPRRDAFGVQGGVNLQMTAESQQSSAEDAQGGLPSDQLPETKEAPSPGLPPDGDAARGLTAQAQGEAPEEESAMPLEEQGGYATVADQSPLEEAGTDQSQESPAVLNGPPGLMRAEEAQAAAKRAQRAQAEAAPSPPSFTPCTNQGCDTAHMLNMPPLVDEINRSWIGDDTNRTWLDEMTGGKPTGSSMEDSPFVEKGGGPGQWYVRRFDKETVPGWWETEPGPGESNGNMIPGPHDRIYRGLEQNTRGEWKKEADGHGGFRWVFYSPWRKPKPEIGTRHGVGMWATEKNAEGAVRWVWCGPAGRAGAAGDKSLDGYGEPRTVEGACHGVNLEQERLKQLEEKKQQEAKERLEEEAHAAEEEAEAAREERAAHDAEVVEEAAEDKKRDDEDLVHDAAAVGAIGAEQSQNGHPVGGKAPWLHPSREVVDSNAEDVSPPGAPWLHPVVTPNATSQSGDGFWARDDYVFGDADKQEQGELEPGDYGHLVRSREAGFYQEGLGSGQDWQEKDDAAKTGTEDESKDNEEDEARQEEEAGDSDGEGQGERTGTVAWDMADDEPVRPQWPWTEEEKAKRALQEDDPDYRDVKRETYEAQQYPRESDDDVEVEEKEKEEAEAEVEAKAEKKAEYPKYIVNPKGTKDAYDFDGVLKRKEEEVAEEKRETEEVEQEEEDKEARLEAEQARIDEEKKELETASMDARVGPGEKVSGPGNAPSRGAAARASAMQTGLDVLQRQEAASGLEGSDGPVGGPPQKERAPAMAPMEGDSKVATAGEPEGPSQGVAETPEDGAPHEASAGEASAGPEGLTSGIEASREAEDEGDASASRQEENSFAEKREKDRITAEQLPPDPSKPFRFPYAHEFDTPATGDKEPPEYPDSREYYDDQNKDDPNGLWGNWRQDPLGLPKGVAYKSARRQSLAAIPRQLEIRHSLPGKGMHSRGRQTRSAMFPSLPVALPPVPDLSERTARESESPERGRGDSWVGLERGELDRGADDFNSDKRGGTRKGRDDARRGHISGQALDGMQLYSSPLSVAPVADLSRVRVDDRFHSDVGTKAAAGRGQVPGEAPPTFNLLSLLSGYTLGGGDQTKPDLAEARAEYLQKEMKRDEMWRSRMHRPDEPAGDGRWYSHTFDHFTKHQNS